jgi:hypothetical protein
MISFSSLECRFLATTLLKSYLKAGLATGAKAEAEARRAATQKVVFILIVRVEKTMRITTKGEDFLDLTVL